MSSSDLADTFAAASLWVGVLFTALCVLYGRSRRVDATPARRDDPAATPEPAPPEFGGFLAPTASREAAA